jgi:mycothiol synthase
MTDLLLPHGASVPGLSFRAYRGEEDIPAIAELLQASFAANGDTLVVRQDELAVEFRNAPSSDPRVDMILGFVADRLVARSWLDWADTPDGSARYYQSWGDVHPEWRRRGIGLVMWRRNIDRLTQVARADGFRGRRVLTVPWLRQGDVGGAVLAERLGYCRVRTYHHMSRPTLEDIAVPTMPTGLEVRPVTTAQLRDVWEAMMEAFRDHFGAWDTGEASYRSWLERPTLDTSLLVVAFDGERIAGGVHGLIDPVENEAQGYRRGWLDDVYTRRPWRRRGLASALMCRALVLLRDRGMTSAQLDVDTENANDALALYRRHGFLSDRVATEWHRPLDLAG